MNAQQLNNIIDLINLAIEREKHFIKICQTGEQKDNPQIIRMKFRAEGKLSALEDVYDALARNDLANLWIEAKGVLQNK